VRIVARGAIRAKHLGVGCRLGVTGQAVGGRVFKLAVGVALLAGGGNVCAQQYEFFGVHLGCKIGHRVNPVVAFQTFTTKRLRMARHKFGIGGLMAFDAGIGHQRKLSARPLMAGFTGHQPVLIIKHVFLQTKIRYLVVKIDQNRRKLIKVVALMLLMTGLAGGHIFKAAVDTLPALSLVGHVGVATLATRRGDAFKRSVALAAIIANIGVRKKTVHRFITVIYRRQLAGAKRLPPRYGDPTGQATNQNDR
jgi:hypothetical protein